MGSEPEREKADKSFGNRVGQGEGRGKETTDRVETVHVNGKGRRRFMEKEEEALCVSGVLLFLFCFFLFL